MDRARRSTEPVVGLSGHQRRDVGTFAQRRPMVVPQPLGDDEGAADVRVAAVRNIEEFAERLGDDHRATLRERPDVSALMP